MKNDFADSNGLILGKIVAPMMLLLSLCACSYSVALDELAYNIPAKRFKQNLVVVIDQNTLNRTIDIPSHSPAFVHNWSARIGEMLKQVTDSELALLFNQYQSVTRLEGPVRAHDQVVMELTVLDYRYQHEQAFVSINAVVYKHNEQVLMQKIYRADGHSSEHRHYPVDSFTKKLLVQQATKDALIKILYPLRNDLSDLVARHF